MVSMFEDTVASLGAPCAARTERQRIRVAVAIDDDTLQSDQRRAVVAPSRVDPALERIEHRRGEDRRGARVNSVRVNSCLSTSYSNIATPSTPSFIVADEGMPTTRFGRFLMSSAWIAHENADPVPRAAHQYFGELSVPDLRRRRRPFGRVAAIAATSTPSPPTAGLLRQAVDRVDRVDQVTGRHIFAELARQAIAPGGDARQRFSPSAIPPSTLPGAEQLRQACATSSLTRLIATRSKKFLPSAARPASSSSIFDDFAFLGARRRRCSRPASLSLASAAVTGALSPTAITRASGRLFQECEHCGERDRGTVVAPPSHQRLP